MKWKGFFQSTLAKYVFSYAAILATVVTGLYFIINTQLKQEYLKLYRNESRNQISYVADRISKGLLEIEKADMLLASDVNIIDARYSSADYSHYLVINELKKYCSRNILSSDIIYLDRKSSTAYTTSCQYGISGSSLDLTMYGTKGIVIPGSYYDSDASLNKIFKVTNGSSTLLLFSPGDSSSGSRAIYVLDQNELRSILDACLSKGVSGVELTDPSGRALFSSGSALPPGADGEPSSSGEIITLDLPYPAIRVRALFQKDFIEAATNAVFVNTYLMVGLLVAAGVVIIFFSMKMTYSPLHELKKHITNSRDRFSNDITLLDSTYHASEELNMLLQKRLNNYRTVIRESILGSEALPENVRNTASDSIDKLFASGDKLTMAVVKILFTAPPEGNGVERIRSRFSAAFTCIVLKADGGEASLLIAWKDRKDEDAAALKRPLESILRELPCMIAFSNRSASPLDIARLYSNATAAENFLNPGRRILGYDDIPENTENYEKNYSYQLFDQLADTLEKMDSESSFRLVRELFDSIDMRKDPEMFIRCILIDTATLIGTCISRSSIKYEKYSGVLAHALDLCRKSNYVQTKGEILESFNAMLEILFTESSDAGVSCAQIEAFVKENFRQPDFSITALADHFGVSIAYMSFLFKKKFSVNFSSYVWRLRYEKSRLLLATTNYSIEKIGALVGYDNASSFRRKFKDECGVSPSQYRKKARETPDMQPG